MSLLLSTGIWGFITSAAKKSGGYVSTFVSGLSGWIIKHNGDAEFKSIYARDKIVTNEYVYNRIRVTEDEEVVTSNGKILSATDNEDGTYTVYLDLREGDSNPFAEGDLLQGYYHSTGNSGVIYAVQKLTVIEDPNMDDQSMLVTCENGSLPYKYMIIVRIGNTINSDRQSFIKISSRTNCQYFHDGINSFAALDNPDNVKCVLGKADMGLVPSWAQAAIEGVGKWFGLIADGVILRGTFILKSSGTTVEEELEGTANQVRSEYTTDFSILSGKVESKVSQTDFNALGNRVSSAESSITQLPNQIASKVSQTDFNALGQRVSSAESSITQLPNQIALSVTESKQYTDGKVDAVQVGGRNYVILSKLASYGPYNTTPVVTGNVISTKLVKASTAGLNFTIYVSGYSPNVGDTYTISGYMKHNGNPVTSSMWLRKKANTDNETLKFYVDDSTGRFEITTKWNRASSWLLHTIIQGEVNDVFNIEFLKFEKGNKATDWSPAPEDVDAEIALRPTTDQIKAEFTIDPTGISMLGEKIALTGMVTFTALDASAQATINSKATGNDIATKLGYSNYTDMINKATAGKTIINGGYINTNLVKADEIVTNMLLCRDSDGNIVSAVNREGDGAFRTYYANGQMQMEFRPTETNGVIASYSPTGLLNWKIGAGANFITNNIDFWGDVFLYPTTETGSGVLNTTSLVGTKYLHYQAASGSPLSSYSGLTMKGTYSNSISPDKVTVQMMITNGWYTYAGPPYMDVTQEGQPIRYFRTLMRYANGYIDIRKEVVFDA